MQWVGGPLGLAPARERDFIKRVVGLPGDRVTCCDDTGRVTVNGFALDERAYLYPGDAPSAVRFDVVVPTGRLWLMGDHRGSSQDSRSLLGEPGGGMVPQSRVLGRAFVVVWPLGDLRLPRATGDPWRARTGRLPGRERRDRAGELVARSGTDLAPTRGSPCPRRLRLRASRQKRRR